MIQKFQKILTQDRVTNQIQVNIENAVNPLIALPLSNNNILTSIPLINGANVVNHGLGRDLQGWFIIRQRAVFASFYDTQDTNNTPNLTLNLVASANVTVDIFVF